MRVWKCVFLGTIVTVLVVMFATVIALSPTPPYKVVAVSDDIVQEHHILKTGVTTVDGEEYDVYTVYDADGGIFEYYYQNGKVLLPFEYENGECVFPSQYIR